MLTRRAFAGVAAAAAPISLRAASKPNFLFLIADDHAGYVMGCDGNAKAATPNLDRLASEGTRFAANYCNSPVCTPSRQSFLTGQLPHAAGVTVLRTSLDPAKPTIAKQLKLAGYNTAVFGKMHFNRPAEAGLYGFDHMMTEGDLTRAWNAAQASEIPASVPTRKLPWRPFATHAREWLNGQNLPYPRDRAGMRSSFQVREIAKYLEENKGKPFALWASFMEPHSPFDFPVGERKFKGEQFTPPEVRKEEASQVPLIFRDLTPDEKTNIIAAYYNSARFLDSSIGAVLDLLEKHGLAENTFVVYMADHGYSLGQHGRFEKHCGYDPALRVPLIMRWPGRIRRGVVKDFTESVDVPHTILDMLGAPPFEVRHGSSLRPYLEGKRPDSRRGHIFSEYLENEEAFVRTATHKLVFCSGKRERTDGYKTDSPTPGRYTRLFDLRSDPGEFKDVSVEQTKVADRLKGVLLERFRKTHPEAAQEPQRLSVEESLEWYLRPRDAAAPAEKRNA
jgi:choline-sulfatase